MPAEKFERPYVDPTPRRVRSFIESIPLYQSDDDPSFWPDDRLREVQDKLFRRQVGWLQEASPYYQRVLKKEGIDARDIQSINDLAHFPVTMKAELMADPESFRLRFRTPTIYDFTMSTVYTSGTTAGRPTPYEYTSHDFFGVLLGARRTLKASYVVPGDCMLSVFPLSPLPHIAGFASMQASSVGASFAHALTGTLYSDFPLHHCTTEVIDQIAVLHPQVITGISSYLRRLFADAAYDQRDLSCLRVVIASGETLTLKMRDHLHANLAACGAPKVHIVSSYGFTEGGISWTWCHEGGLLHASAPDQCILEILDPSTYERVQDGQKGLVALTHLNRRGMPLVRFLLGDISTMIHGECPYCGRRGESLSISAGSSHVYRTTELLKVKGVIVNPQVLHDVIMNTEGILEYQIMIMNKVAGDPESGDRVVIRIAPDQGPDTSEWTDKGGRIERLRIAVFNAAEITPEVELVDDPSTIFCLDKDFKPHRVSDQRSARI